VGKIQRVKPESKVGYNDSVGGTVRTRRNLWLTIALCCGTIGCTTVKKATVVATGAAVGATAGTVLSGGVIAPIAGAMTTAFVVDVATEISHRTSVSDMDCAPDNIWTIMQSLVEIGGWALLLIFVAPMVIGWILPGPLEKKKKS
jgi:hypothetical protein